MVFCFVPHQNRWLVLTSDLLHIQIMSEFNTAYAQMYKLASLFIGHKYKSLLVPAC
jgi:hypothetical protein